MKSMFDHDGVWILIITCLSALLFCEGLGRLGIDHFDEGIYASAGTWALDRGGLSNLDPGLIPYAPPVYPILVGLLYRVIGVSDLAAVIPALLSGIALVGLVGWLGFKWFGLGRGVIFALLASASGYQVFSKMALTDATFALTWALAIAAGIRFLSNPRAGRAVIMGLAVGLAQLTKYNGWLSGAIVILAAISGLIFDKEQRTIAKILRIFGWGLLGALVASTVYWPWFQFVEAHGGYADLLRHQRSYLGTAASWPSHLLSQLKQSQAFSSRPYVVLVFFPFWKMFMWLIHKENPGPLPRQFLRDAKAQLVNVILFLVFLAGVLLGASWWTGLVIAPILITRREPAERVLGTWWLVLTILTPWYHPYSRLWLPLEVVGWLFNGLVLAILWDRFDSKIELPRSSETRALLASPKVLGAVLVSMLLGQILDFATAPHSRIPAGPGEPRDSLRIAAAQFAANFPPGVDSVRVLARPALNFYLAPALASKGIRLTRAADLNDLTKAPGSLAILDTVQILQEIPDKAKREVWLMQFEILARTKNELSVVTLLDVDPSAATGNMTNHTQEILLLKRKTEQQP